MTVYNVGLDDSKPGFFGHQRTTIEFEDAIFNAKTGDTIIIQSNYTTPQPRKNYVIKQSINIRGEVGEQVPVIQDGIIVDGATVAVENINFVNTTEKTNIFQVKNKGKIISKNVNILSQTQGEVYPLIYIHKGSELVLNSTYVSSAENATNPSNGSIYIDGGKASIINCTTELPIKNYKEGDISVENSELYCSVSNVLTGKEKSKTRLQDSKLAGGNTEKDVPCLYVENATLTGSNVTVLQQNYNAALYLCKSAKGDLKQSFFSSIGVDNSSILDLKETSRIFESLSVERNSVLNTDTILIDGDENGRVNLFADENSSIKGDWIGFGQSTSPTVKRGDSTILNIEFYMLQYSAETNEYAVNESGECLLEDSQVKIEVFSEKRSDSNSQIKKEKSVEEKKENIKSTKKLSAFEALDQMIGLNRVKEQVKEFVAVSVVNKKRMEKGLSVNTQTLHSIFAGNPGTGKTTVARLLGQLLFEKGVIKKNLLIETSRADLVAQYIGQTAVKTRKVLESALGGILFIDEAYTLTPNSDNDFGGEAINEILKFMEDHRAEIMIIFAGYSNEMEKFLQTNSGLKSRIPNTFDFEDYSSDEMIDIGLSMLRADKYEVNEEIYKDVFLNNLKLSNDHSNGRWVRNFNESIQKSKP